MRLMKITRGQPGHRRHRIHRVAHVGVIIVVAGGGGVGGFKSGAAPIPSAAVRLMPAFASTWLAKEWGHREARVTGAYRGHHAPHRRNTSQSTVLRMLAMKAHVVCVRSTRYVSRAVVVRHRPRPRHVVMEQKRAVIPWRSWEDQRGDTVR